jgi:hypothetical protein
MRRTVAVASLLGLAAFAGAACGGLGGGGDDSGSQALMKGSADAGPVASGGGAAAVAQEAVANAGADGDEAKAAAGAPLPAGLGEPKVVKTASVDLEVTKGGFDAAFSRVPTIAAAHGGFVASSSSSRANGDRDDGAQAAGSVVVRVPSAEFDATRQELIGLGTLRSQQLKGDDVGGQLTDLDARLRNLRSQEEAIRLLMTKTGTIGETIEVQRQLSTVREEIERLAGEQARLNEAVTYSTLTLSLAEPGVAVEEPGDVSSIREAINQAWDGAQSVIAGVIVALGYLVPLGLLAALGWLAVRPFVPRRRDVAGPEPVSS